MGRPAPSRRLLDAGLRLIVDGLAQSLPGSVAGVLSTDESGAVELLALATSSGDGASDATVDDVVARARRNAARADHHRRGPPAHPPPAARPGGHPLRAALRGHRRPRHPAHRRLGARAGHRLRGPGRERAARRGRAAAAGRPGAVGRDGPAGRAPGRLAARPGRCLREDRAGAAGGVPRRRGPDAQLLRDPHGGRAGEHTDVPVVGHAAGHPRARGSGSRVRADPQDEPAAVVAGPGRGDQRPGRAPRPAHRRRARRAA